MNILVQQLPETVEIDSQEVPLNTDFRDCLRVILAFEDSELTAAEKRLVLLAALYPAPPPDLAAAFDLGVLFLNGGEDPDPETARGPRLYSFAQDASYIFAAFRQTHSIDLEAVEHLHWWKFLALFRDLGQDTTFCQMVALRQRYKSGRASKWEREMYLQMRDVLDLDEPDTRTADERARADEFYRLAEEGKRKRAEAQAQA